MGMYLKVFLTFSVFQALGIFQGVSSAIAQELGDEVLVGPSDQQVIVVTVEQCQLLTPHIPDADVEYKPGVDARGRDVAPADIEGANQLNLGENGYSFFITHDALKDSNIANEHGLTGSQEGKIVLGQVTVKDGDVLWNGQSLREADRNRIYMLCNEERRGKRRPIFKR